MLGLYQQGLSLRPVEAWKYGPVIPDVYHSLKRYGRDLVTQPIGHFGSDFDDIEEDLIQQVFDIYKPFSGIELSQMTHAEGTPWSVTWHRYGRNSIIPNELIEEHFSKQT